MIRRLLFLRLVGPRNLLRTFAQSPARRTEFRGRPQVPFLSVTTSRGGGRVRYLTTERRAQLKYEIKTGIKYTGYIWIAGASFLAIWFAVVQERLERRYPTPHEWSYRTRMDFRGGNCARFEPEPGQITDWLQVASWFETTVNRLHDPAIDGQGVKDARGDCPPGTKDVTEKSEEWRMGYYEVLMGFAKAAEYVDGWVLDKSRNIVFPAGTMIGPSNPFPKPLPPGFKGAPREEDCEVRFDSPDLHYLRILSTPGFTNRQKIDAGLAYASWLDFKGTTGPASLILEDTIHLAATERPNLPSPALNPQTYTLNQSAGPPSENLLTALTAYATFHARHGNLTTALPIFVSLLRARRTTPSLSTDTPLTAALAHQTPHSLSSRRYADPDRSIWSQLTAFFLPPAYPPPPPDGTAPPLRDSLAICQEAALSLHIGEIMFATTTVEREREEALGWTREAVDMAEEQLHRAKPQQQIHHAPGDDPTRTACRECLATGLGNWTAMVSKLAREEEKKKAGRTQKQQQPGWFSGLSLWSSGNPGSSNGKAGEGNGDDRWAAEAKVIQDRKKRAAELLEDLPQPPRGVFSFLQA
ncbi:hypothetical protein B0J18DRAFT_421278 [Chaetomium sp. MPI-SDFR-AT-0129]|nr:hypothetical protein B0J18DRAFT_421278 [Chaetomium sp. MPI-SDFR-AT-0129]